MDLVDGKSKNTDILGEKEGILAQRNSTTTTHHHHKLFIFQLTSKYYAEYSKEGGLII